MPKKCTTELVSPPSLHRNRYTSRQCVCVGRMKNVLSVARFVLLVVAVVCPHGTDGFFLFRLWSPCRSIDRLERCGFLNLSVKMHTGEANSKTCVEQCVFFVDTTNMNCGTCTIIDNSDTSQPGYNMYLDLVNITGYGNGTYFHNARTKWEGIITTDIRDVSTVNLNYNSPGCTVPTIVDDLYICAKYDKIGRLLWESKEKKERLSNQCIETHKFNICLLLCLCFFQKIRWTKGNLGQCGTHPITSRGIMADHW
jgi:hypothetical protein